MFDQLFRKHLKNVYILLHTPYPHQLDRPIGNFQHRAIHTEPKSFLKVKINGRQSYFEWINAGHYISGSERGTMTMVTEGLMRKGPFRVRSNAISVKNRYRQMERASMI